MKTKFKFPFAKLILSIFVAVACVAGASYLMTQSSNDDVKKLGFKTSELAIQVLLVVVAGGIVVKEYERVRAKKEAINDFRKGVLHDLIQAYSDTKKIRRLLRAKCQTLQTEDGCSNDAIKYEIYDERMPSINETQLSLEIMNRELKVFVGAFEEADELNGCVKTMESYLGKIIDEYERVLKSFEAGTCIPLDRIERFAKFIAKGDTGDFSCFSEAFRRGLQIIQETRVKV